MVDCHEARLSFTTVLIPRLFSRVCVTPTSSMHRDIGWQNASKRVGIWRLNWHALFEERSRRSVDSIWHALSRGLMQLCDLSDSLCSFHSAHLSPCDGVHDTRCGHSWQLYPSRLQLTSVSTRSHCIVMQIHLFRMSPAESDADTSVQEELVFNCTNPNQHGHTTTSKFARLDSPAMLAA